MILNTPLFQPPEGEEHPHTYHSLIEERINKILSPFEQFIRSQVLTGILLIISIVAAVVFASIDSINANYNHLIALPIGFQWGKSHFIQPLYYWTNHILLTLFFFIVGLEIKREFLVGTLMDKKFTTLILFSALGGVLLPATVYLLINNHSIYVSGWAIPSATDTALAMGFLILFKCYLPQDLFTFMATLAIVDDIVSIVIVATYYNQHITVIYLLMAGLFLIALLLINYAGIRRASPYFLLGIGTWFMVEISGLHGTLAGVAVAFTIPARPQKGPNQFIKNSKRLLQYFTNLQKRVPRVLEDQAQHATIEQLKREAEQATTPLQRWESALELPISLLVLPIFAFVNAGINFDISKLKEIFSSSVVIGIIVALTVGKPTGIILFCWLSQYCKIGRLPKALNFSHVIVVACTGGIGFTMSLLIAALAFNETSFIFIEAKTGILVGSLLSCCTGLLSILYFFCRRTNRSKIKVPIY